MAARFCRFAIAKSHGTFVDFAVESRVTVACAETTRKKLRYAGKRCQRCT